jgi:polar amino acid transport system substrate-binding protein
MASKSDLRLTRRGAGALIVGSLFALHAGAGQTVTLATTDYPPYYGSLLAQGGVIAEIAREALKRCGYTLAIEWYPWARALRLAQEGGVDGLLGVWRSAEREQWLAYSLPLPANQVGFFRRADSPIAFKAMGELRSQRIGVVRGYVNPKAFVEARLNTEEAVDDTANLRKLGAGRVDLILIDKGVAQYLLLTAVPELQGKLAWVEPAIEVFPVHVGFVKGGRRHQELLEAFNRGLKEMERDGTLQRLVAQAGL